MITRSASHLLNRLFRHIFWEYILKNLLRAKHCARVRMGVIWIVFLLYHIEGAMFVLPLVDFCSLINHIDRLLIHHLARHKVGRSADLLLVLTSCVVSFREAILDSPDRTVISIAISLQILDSGKSSSLLECILIAATLVIVAVLLGLGVTEPWSFVHNRVLILHRVFSHARSVRLFRLL